MSIFFQILSAYLVLIGTWRLANATTKAPIGSEVGQYQESEEAYNPLKDFVSIVEVGCWLIRTIKELRVPGSFANAVIHEKKFQWGLFWLMCGIFIQIGVNVTDALIS